jgi:hypothetical protein
LLLAVAAVDQHQVHKAVAAVQVDLEQSQVLVQRLQLITLAQLAQVAQYRQTVVTVFLT